jgi:methionyl-tRNA formyltransferase
LVLDGQPTHDTVAPPGELAGVEVGTGDGGYRLGSVQPEGRKPLDALAWRNGARVQPGERLGT